MASKWIKNNTVGDLTWVGQLISAGTYYQVQAVERVSWSNNSALLTAIGSGDAIVAKDDSGNTDILSVNQAISYLKDLPTEVDSEGVPLVRTRAFANTDGFRVRFTGVNGVAVKAINGTTPKVTNIDYKLTEDRFINGVRLLIAGAEVGDYVDFQVIDIDNILGYGADTVLDEFGTSWWIDASTVLQPDVLVPYPAKIASGLYIRIAYTSVGITTDVNVRANLYLHKKAT